METVYIVLIVVAAIVVLAVAWMYRNRLTEGSFEGTEKGVKATLKAASPAGPSAARCC